MKILVAGGAGYIGTHASLALMAQGHEVVIADSLVNSRPSVLQRVERLAQKPIGFCQVDVCRQEQLDAVFAAQAFDAVINFAGYKSVGDSVEAPLGYYRNNLNAALTLLESMRRHDVRIFVFSSSAAVYGNPSALPITEGAALKPHNPYGRTKLFIEEILRDLSRSDSNWKIAILRYFNPVGGVPGGELGEQPAGTPGNLVPLLSLVAAGKRERLQVFGGDYDTPDGTAIRDYIHVMDLARGHVAAMQKLAAADPGTLLTLNFGTGRGYSVLEMIDAFARASGREIPYEVVARRPGDPARSFADPGLAKRELGWEASYGLDDMCRHAWQWQCRLDSNSDAD